MKIGLLVSRLRAEEKLLLAALRKQRVDFEQIDVRDVVFDLNIKKMFDVDLIFERCISSTHALYATKILEDRGFKTINRYDVIKTCGDKIFTTLLLEKHKVPTIQTRVAFTQESALRAVEDMGYPVVLKPAVGSWGRLLTKADNQTVIEAVLEHKQTLGTYHHSIFYIQKYIEKPGRDIRAFFVGNETICAIYRTSPHWITNTARGGKATNCPITPELNELCCKAAEAVGGGLLAMDVFETEDGLIINEINPTMEFRNSIHTTGVDIPGKIVEYVKEQGRR